MKRILVIDDEQAICTSLQFALEDEFQVITATCANEGLDILRGQRIDLVLLDWRLKGEDGLHVLRDIKALYRDINVIMMTAFGTIQSSVEAMKQGAYYYITKPLNIDQLKLLIHKALEYSHLTKEIKRLHNSLHRSNRFDGMIGKSKEMEKVFCLIEKVKDIESNVLITGESGTGKELVAQAIHNNGRRKDKPFEVVNCAAIPENLLESELFGHRRGAFTGAVSDRVGKCIQADGGTLFLDEVGELPLSLQAKILRVIQEREVTPLGSHEKVKVNFRLIAATNRDLLEMVKRGEFREDLYFRLNVIPITLPPLRKRKEDIPLLVNHFLHEYCEKMGKTITDMSQDVKRFLYEYDYPGNVRELSNIIEHAVALSNSEKLESEDLPPVAARPPDDSVHAVSGNEPSIVIPIGKKLKEIEKMVILETLSHCKGHRERTAAMVGISVRSLRNKLKQYRS